MLTLIITIAFGAGLLLLSLLMAYLMIATARLR